MDVKITLPLLPLRDIVVFPSMVIPLFVGRDKSISALNEVMKKDKKSKKYEEGVSCPNCHDNLTDHQKSRFRMRQKHRMGQIGRASCRERV